MMWVCLPIKRHTDRIAGLRALETFYYPVYVPCALEVQFCTPQYSRLVSPLVYILFYRTLIRTPDLANLVHDYIDLGEQ